MTISQALLSVSDKAGIVDFARALHQRGVRLLSTGGTAKALRDHDIPVIEVSDYTGFPEMLDGRVKTLHPKIHGALLGRRSLPEHVAKMREHGIENIDLVCVNLYPFTQTIAKPDCSLDDAIENIDIGGPAMIRSAAKNWEHVTVIVDPSDYARVLTEMAAHGGVTTRETRFALAAKVYSHTAAYDGAISSYLTSIASLAPTVAPAPTVIAADAGTDAPIVSAAAPERSAYPGTLNLQFSKVQEMRYGENPHQSAAFYREAAPAAGSLANYTQLQGKELSYNNIGDADPRGNASSLSIVPLHAASSSSTPTPAAWRLASTRSMPIPRRSRPTPRRRSAASSPSTACSMAQRLKRWPNSLSKW